MPSSELILNADGSIYHLGLHPDQLAPVIITVGDPERVAQVSAHFEETEFELHRREFVTHLGRFAGRRIMCISTGIGTDNVDIVLNELDALANVDFDTGQPREHLTPLTFLRLGTSGTFQRSIPVDSIIASRDAVGLDGLGPSYRFGPHAGAKRMQAAYPEFAGAAYGAVADAQLLQSWSDERVIVGSTLTCSGFYGPQRRSLRLPFAGPSLAELADLRFGASPGSDRGGDFTNFEMETAGIYALAQALGHRALSVSAILANRATDSFSTEPAATVERLIGMAFQQFRSRPELWWGDAVS